MKISEILKNNKASISFEVFPPKKEASFDAVEKAIGQIAALKPAFMSVTYGAGGGTSIYTLDIAKDMQAKYDIPMLAHLTCVSSTKETVSSMIQAFEESGIENIMALRGDIPSELADNDRSTWPYKHAIELISELKEAKTDFCIGCACYPEIHPESTDQHEDLMHLNRW